MGASGEKRRKHDEIESKEEIVNEGLIKGAEEIETLDKSEFKEKNKCICKISGETIGTGFFTKIKVRETLIPVLITNYHIISDNFLKNKNELKFYVNDDSKIININKKSIIYSSITNKYDIIIIKLDEDEIKDYLEIDENIFKINSENAYKNEHIYILHYPYSNKASISYGYGIEQIDEFYIKHLCNTEPGSSGGPILSRLTNKIIGIHKGCINKIKERYNIGTFLKFPLDELNPKNDGINFENINEIPLNNINQKKYQIVIKIKVEENDINKDIYFLDNTYEKKLMDNYIPYHDNLKELNKDNTELYINGIKKEYEKYFIPEMEGLYTIILKFDISLKNCSNMFDGCSNIISIDLSNFDTTNTTKMNKMFSKCKSLKSISGISEWNTSNVITMYCMFYQCNSIESLPDISNWNTKKVTDMESMFSKCESLKSLPDISKWNTSNVNNMRWMFEFCESLISLPDISKWNTKNLKNISYMFSHCISLKSLPDISKWNTKNVTKIHGIFNSCKSLISLPDISKWNMANAIDIGWMFRCCESLMSLPDISNWNLSKVTDIHGMFEYCESLKSLPDISKWNTMNVTDMSNMFYSCKSLIALPDISKWNIENVTDLHEMLNGCKSLQSLPDISLWNTNEDV